MRATKRVKHPFYTLGHSSHSLQACLGLLTQHGISTVADVRSAPYSRRYPHFCRDPLEAALAEAGIGYVFLGRQLGARSRDPACYENGKVQYERLARTALFQEGLDRLQELADSEQVAIMCAEREPLDCHRTILLARHLVERGDEVRHILADGAVEPHCRALRRLRHQLGIPEDDFFMAQSDLNAEAYRRQGERIAFEGPPASTSADSSSRYEAYREK